MALLYDTFKVEMPPWSVYNSYQCYLDNCYLCYDSVKEVYVCVKHKTNHVCGWATDNYEQEGAYQGPKCPVVENDEGWLVCEMTGQVLDSQCKYLPNPMPQEYKCDEEEPMMILTDHEINNLFFMPLKKGTDFIREIEVDIIDSSTGKTVDFKDGKLICTFLISADENL